MPYLSSIKILGIHKRPLEVANSWVLFFKKSFEFKFWFIWMEKNSLNINIFSVFMMKIREKTCYSLKRYVARNLKCKTLNLSSTCLRANSAMIIQKLDMSSTALPTYESEFYFAYNNERLSPLIFVASPELPPCAD